MDVKGGSIGKGILLAFGLLLGLVAIIGGIFLAIYIYSIVLGAIFQVANDDITFTNVVNESFLASNTTNATLLIHPINFGTLVIYNETDTQNLDNFTIEYSEGKLILVPAPSTSGLLNGSTLFANYTGKTVSKSTLPLSDSTNSFLNNTEASYFTTAGDVTAGAEFAGSLIPIAIILLVFGGLLVGAIVGYQAYKKRKGGNLDY